MWTGESSLDDALAGLAEVRLAIRRSALALVLWVMVCNGLGVAYLLAVRPDFIASVEIVLQPRRIARDGPEDLRQDHQLALDGEQAETQLRVIRSAVLLRSVFTALDIANAPEIRGDQPGLWSGLARQLHRLAPGAKPVTADDRAFGAFTDRVRSRRLGLSYVIDISYRAQSGSEAARVANAVAAAYVRERVTSAITEARGGVPYLRQRISEMVGETLTAGEAVQTGTVPAAYLPDADVRLLGPATAPLAKAFPRPAPVLMLASAFGLLSGLLLVLLQNRLGTAIGSREQLRRRLGLDCAVIPVGRRGAFARADLFEPFRMIRAGLAATEVPRVGFVSWRARTGAAPLAAAFASHLGENGTQSAVLDLERGRPVPQGAGPDTVKAGHAGPEPGAALVMALPPLRDSLGALELLPALDGTVLVIEARRTTYPELRSALRAIGTAKVVPVAIVMLDSRMAGRADPRGALVAVRTAVSLTS